MSQTFSKIWLVRRNGPVGYDQYDALVVFAETEEEARCIHPYDDIFWDEDKKEWWYKDGFRTSLSWPDPDSLTVEYLGTTDRMVQPGVILGSFNAG